MTNEELVTKLQNFLFDTDMSIKARQILNKAYDELVAISDFDTEIHEHGILSPQALRFINGKEDTICFQKENKNE